MSKFTDIYEKNLKEETIQDNNKEKPKNNSLPKHIDINEEQKTKGSFSDSYTRELIREQIREEFTQELRKEIEEEVTEKIKKRLFESVLQEIKENTEIQVSTANKNSEMLIKAIERLNEKILSLTEGLNVEVPTPVVNVIQPKTRKKIIRDNKGHIIAIEDADQDEEDLDGNS